MDHEQRARMVKAHKIAGYCRTVDVTAETLLHEGATTIQAALRSEICKAAGVNQASAETWAVVIGLLGAQNPASEALKAALPLDPFDGLAATSRPVRTGRPTSTGRPREDEQ